MKYTLAFAGIKEPELRRLIIGDDAHEPLTSITSVPTWAWEAVHRIAEADGVRVSRVLSRAVRHYAAARGYSAPTDGHAHGEAVLRRRGLMTIIAEFFKCIGVVKQ